MEKKAPKIFKVKDVIENNKFKDIHNNIPQMPALVLIIGSVRSGKSNLLVNFGRSTINLWRNIIFQNRTSVALFHP